MDEVPLGEQEGMKGSGPTTCSDLNASSKVHGKSELILVLFSRPQHIHKFIIISCCVHRSGPG